MKKYYIVLSIVTLIFSNQVGANNCKPEPICTDTTVQCLQLSLTYGPDLEGRGLRYMATFNLAGDLTTPFLQGPIRWFVDGVVVRDTEVVNGNDLYSILRVKDLSSINVTPVSVITARYIGNEQYDSSQVPPPYGAAFETSECQAEIGGLTQKFPWGVSITVDKTEIEFTETVEATATWDSVDFDQDVLTGRFTLLNENGIVLGEGSVAEKTGTIYHPKVKSSTLGLGQHTFGGSYLGIEGGLSLNTSETVTVRTPRRPLILRIEPEDFIRKSGSDSNMTVCAANSDGNQPTGIDGREIQVTIDPQNAVAVTVPITTVFNSNACAQITVPSLAPGKYSVAAIFKADNRFKRSKTSNIMTIVPDVVPAVIAPNLPAVSGTSTVTTNFITPGEVILSNTPPAITYEVLPTGMVFQAEVLPTNLLSQRPVGELLFLINGQLITLRRLEQSPYGFTAFGPFDLAPGEYTATLAYTGDDTYASYISDNIVFTINDAGKPSFPPQPGMQQDFAGIKNDFKLSLSSNVDRFYVNSPVVLTGLLLPIDSVTPNKGIPVGTMIFKNGNVVLGEVRLSGFRGSIRLPAGLPSGSHDLYVEYQE